MPKSALTTKNQTTVPREVRERLGLGAGGVLNWELIPGGAKVSAAGASFLELRGAVRVGPGSVVEDVKHARRVRGTIRG